MIPTVSRALTQPREPVLYVSVVSQKATTFRPPHTWLLLGKHLLMFRFSLSPSQIHDEPTPLHLQPTDDAGGSRHVRAHCVGRILSHQK